MAYQTGTASNYLDLLARINTFVTTGLGSVNWTSNLADTTGSHSPYGPDTQGYSRTAEYWWKAPGLSGSQAFYVGLQAMGNPTGDAYNLGTGAAVGYVSASLWGSQPGQCPFSAGVLLWNTSIPYWLVANGQRLACVMQVGTQFEHLYLGAYLPYGTPSEAPYPMFTGGTNSSPFARYSVVGENHRAYWNGNNNGGTYAYGDAALYWPDGSWPNVGNVYGPGGGDTNYSTNWVFTMPWIASMGNNCRESADGSTYPIQQAEILATAPTNNVLGALDGIYWVPGFGLTSGDTITVGGNTYLVSQNITRTNNYDYMAMLLA